MRASSSDAERGRDTLHDRGGVVGDLEEADEHLKLEVVEARARGLP